VSGKVMDIQDLQHLESVVDKAGSSLLVVFFYTRSCGVCKELLRDFTQLCEEVSTLSSGSHVPRLNSLAVTVTVSSGAAVLPKTPSCWLLIAQVCTVLLPCCRQNLRKSGLCLRATTCWMILTTVSAIAVVHLQTCHECPRKLAATQPAVVPEQYLALSWPRLLAIAYCSTDA